jgi:hypothetical protein
MSDYNPDVCQTFDAGSSKPMKDLQNIFDENPATFAYYDSSTGYSSFVLNYSVDAASTNELEVTSTIENGVGTLWSVTCMKNTGVYNGNLIFSHDASGVLTTYIESIPSDCIVDGKISVLFSQQVTDGNNELGRIKINDVVLRSNSALVSPSIPTCSVFQVAEEPAPTTGGGGGGTSVVYVQQPIVNATQSVPEPVEQPSNKPIILGLLLIVIVILVTRNNK